MHFVCCLPDSLSKSSQINHTNIHLQNNLNSDRKKPTRNHGSMSQSIVYSYHEYELAELGLLQFLENLLSDPHSYLSNRDINSILGCLERRECNIPFSIDSSQACDNQGIVWTRDLRRKFQLDRWRVGRQLWFHNVDQLREHAIKVSDPKHR